jgi:hypothetical protein
MKEFSQMAASHEGRFLILPECLEKFLDAHETLVIRQQSELIGSDTQDIGK